MNNSIVRVDMNKEYMISKDYNPNLWTILNSIEPSHVEWSDGKVGEVIKFYSIDDVKKTLRERLFECLSGNCKPAARRVRQSRYANRFYDEFVELGIFKEHLDEGTVEINDWFTNGFLKLPIDIAEYCLVNLPSINFKLYCILFNEWNKRNGKVEFSITGKNGLMEQCGYKTTRNQNEIRRFKLRLQNLSDLGLIKYNSEPISKSKNGVYVGEYYTLLSVNDYTKSIKEQREKVTKVIEEKSIETKTLDRMVFELNHFNDYFVVEGGWGRTLAKYIRKYNVGEEVWKEAIRESLFHDSYIEETEKVLRNA